METVFWAGNYNSHESPAEGSFSFQDMFQFLDGLNVWCWSRPCNSSHSFLDWHSSLFESFLLPLGFFYESNRTFCGCHLYPFIITLSVTLTCPVTSGELLSPEDFMAPGGIGRMKMKDFRAIVPHLHCIVFRLTLVFCAKVIPPTEIRLHYLLTQISMDSFGLDFGSLSSKYTLWHISAYFS